MATMDLSKNPVLILGLALIGILILGTAVFLLWQQFGLPALAVALVAILVIVFLGFTQKKASLQELFRKKREILDSLQSAEKRFLDRTLDEETYAKIKDEKQKKLVEIETKIAVLNQVQAKAPNESIDAASPKNRHRLEELYAQKSSRIQENELSEKKYFNREIDEKTFFELRGTQEAQLLEIDSQIKKIESDEAARRVMAEMREKLKKIDETEIQKKRREGQEMTDDVFDQTNR